MFRLIKKSASLPSVSLEDIVLSREANRQKTEGVCLPKSRDNPVAADIPKNEPVLKNEHFLKDAALKLTSHQILDLVESDLSVSMLKLNESVEHVTLETFKSNEAITSIREQTHDLTASSFQINSDISILASSADQLSRSAVEISRNVSGVSKRSRDALLLTREVRSTIEEWSNSSKEISATISEIAKIAKKINLLALNATIEAARAGDAGRGFAVVAQEVKDLANASALVSSTIQQRLEKMFGNAERVIHSINEVSSTVEAIDPVFANVSSSVEEQVQSVAALAQNAAHASHHLKEVTQIALKIDENACKAQQIGCVMQDSTMLANNQVAQLTRVFVATLRQSELGDRRKHDRWPIELGVHIHADGQNYTSTSVDLSQGGILISKPKNMIAIPVKAEINLGNIGTVDVTVKSMSEIGIHCAFETKSSSFENKLSILLNTTEIESQNLCERALSMASEVSRVFEAGLDNKLIGMQCLFDVNYIPVQNSSPQQYLVNGLKFYENCLPRILEAYLKEKTGTVFCIAVDRNGYIPVHNLDYSHPQKIDDPLWNSKNSRTRRIFNDRNGIIAARNIRASHLQNYRRDMGGGEYIIMKEANSPIIVHGRHWGGVRIAMNI